MTDLRQECLRARDLLFILPVTNWLDSRFGDDRAAREDSGTHCIWAEVFPGWAQGDYVETRLGTAVHFIHEYLREGDPRHLGFTARYIALFFDNDEAWDRSLRHVVAGQLNNSHTWAAAWRAELLQYGYQFAVAGACSPPHWLNSRELPPAPNLVSV